MDRCASGGNDGLGWLLQVSATEPTPVILAIMCRLALTFGALAYGATRALGMIVVGAVGAAVDGPEWTVDRENRCG